MKKQVSNRIIWLFGILIVVSSLALFFFKVNEHFANLNPVAYGCENDKIPNLTCDPGHVVTDATFSYGRWNNNICPHQTVRNNTPMKWGVYNVPTQYYEGKQELAIGEVSPSTLAKEDPYPNVYKHYQIKGTCQPLTVEQKYTGCDGKKLKSIDCPGGYSIDSATMKYGRWDNKTCPGTNVNINTPSKSKDYPLDPSLYRGKESAIVNMTPIELSKGSDPVPGTKKHYVVTATCKLNN